MHWRLWVISASVCIGIASPQTAQSPQFVAGTTEVEVPLIALDKHKRPIENLSPVAFTLLDNGGRQRVTRVDTDPRPLSLAIVIDTRDENAVAQANRSAELIAASVVGSNGEASIFVPGLQPTQLTAFVGDSAETVYTLRHLPPLSVKCTITAALILAENELKKQSPARTRAILAITDSNPSTGEFAQGLFESESGVPIPIFQIVPRRPKGQWAPPPNPVAPRRVDGSESKPVTQASNGSGGVSLSTDPVADAKAMASLFRDHYDYGYDSGGLRLQPSTDGDFDQALALIGNELNLMYRLYYTPTNLTPQPSLHAIHVDLRSKDATSIGPLSYRRAYFGFKPR